MTDPAAVAAVALYAALNGLVLIWLAAQVGRLRGALGVSIGDGGEPRLIRAMRGQANFVELAPMTLILMFGLAFLGAPPWLLHALGLALTVGRALHGLHFMQADAPRWQRAAGAVLSLGALLFAAIALLGHAAAAL